MTQKLYDYGTMQLKVRILVDDEDDSNEEEILDMDRRIENYNYYLTVLTRDMNQIKEEFEKDIEVMEKMKNFCSNVNDAVATGASVANNKEECMQDTACMDRMISLRTSIKDYKLGLRMRLFSETNATRNSLCDDDTNETLYAKKPKLIKKLVATRSVKVSLSSFLHVNNWHRGHSHPIKMNETLVVVLILFS